LKFIYIYIYIYIFIFFLLLKIIEYIILSIFIRKSFCVLQNINVISKIFIKIIFFYFKNIWFKKTNQNIIFQLKK